MSDSPRKVLVVEDDPGHAALIQRALASGKGGMELTIASTLAEAKDRIDREAPDVVVADLILPDGQALELLPGSVEEALYPIVIMTSHGDEQLAVESLKSGALDYIVKTDSFFSDMPRLIERSLREWRLVLDRKEAQENLRESEAHYRSLIENALDMITVIDERGVILYQSPSSLRLLGLEAEMLVGESIYRFLHPEDRDEVNAGLMLAFAAPGTKQTIVSRFRHRDRSWRTLESIGSAHDNRRGERRVVVNSRDITSRRKAEEEKRILEAQLRQSQKLETIGTMADGIAHDFNNILTPMLGYAELALEDLPDGNRARSDLEHVIRAATRARNLVEQILLFSRQVEKEREPLELHRVIRESMDLLRASLPANVHVVEKIDERCGAVLADPTQIHQIMMNLGTNAGHAMRPHGGTLTIQLAPVDLGSDFRRRHPQIAPGEYVRLSVIDTGCGMDRATRERIFEPFFTTKEVGEGAGLGLSVVHGIVRNHGGEIAVESEPGRGARIDVHFPRTSAAGIAGADRDDSPLDGTERVLFVDNEMEITSIVKEALERRGYAVTVQTDSVRALEWFEENRGGVDVIIVNESMPVLSGTELARSVQGSRSPVPVILITGFSRWMTPGECREWGVREIVMKPLVTQDLCRAIRRAAGDAGAKQETRNGPPDSRSG